MPSTMANVKHLPANGGSAFANLGQTVSFKAEPEDTDDALFLFEHRIPPTLGVPAHTERNYEAFYVLEGMLEVEADGERYRLGPGEFLSLRPGVVHSLYNPGPGMMRILTLVSPGSQHARFFTTVAEPIEDPTNPPAPVDPPDFERMAAVGRECGSCFCRRLSPTIESKLSAQEPGSPQAGLGHNAPVLIFLIHRIAWRNRLEIPNSLNFGTSMSRQEGQKLPVLLPRVGETQCLDAILTIFQTVSKTV